MPATQLPGVIRHLGLAVAARGSDGLSDRELPPGARLRVGTGWVYTLTYHSGDDNCRVKMVYSTSRTITVDVPFTLRDVPLR